MYYKTFIMIILFLINSFLFASEKVIKIATLPDYAPFCLADESYRVYQSVPIGSDAIGFYGFSWDVVRESFHEMGYTIDISIMPWSRAMNSFRRGENDLLFPTSKNKQRKEIFNYSKNTVGLAKISVYVLADSQIIWKDLTSIEGLTIGVKRAFNYGDKWILNANIDKHYVTTILQGFKMLKLKRFDGFVCYESSCDHMLKQKKWEHIYKKLPFFDLLEDYPVTLKTNPSGINILKDFDIGFKQIVENGKFEKIKSKWFKNQK